MAADEALGRLGQSTAEAVLGVLEMFAAGKVSAGEVTAHSNPADAFAGVPVPCVAMDVSYIDGVTGGNVFLITLDGARDIRERSYSVFHPVGSCRMGPDPSNSVVDPRLRVHGVDGLRVIDASIFPAITSGNTNAPSIMVGERGAELILAE